MCTRFRSNSPSCLIRLTEVDLLIVARPVLGYRFLYNVVLEIQDTRLLPSKPLNTLTIDRKSSHKISSSVN